MSCDLYKARLFYTIKDRVFVHVVSMKHRNICQVLRNTVHMSDSSFCIIFRKDLIHIDIENAVSHMQSVIELGRVVRDRKTLPIKV